MRVGDDPHFRLYTIAQRCGDFYRNSRTVRPPVEIEPRRHRDDSDFQFERAAIGISKSRFEVGGEAHSPSIDPTAAERRIASGGCGMLPRARSSNATPPVSSR